MNYPKNYDQKQYIKWHEATIKEDINLVDKLTKIREDLKTNKDRLITLSELLNTLNTLLIRAKGTNGQDISMLDYKIMLGEQLHNEQYDNIFKSVDSIINKLWRKNRDTLDYTKTENIYSRIKDLARSSIIVSSSGYITDFSNILKGWKHILEINDKLSDDYNDINEIFVEEEAKMDSGYFAYHADIVYKDGNHIEIQIYTQLNEVWRKLSHRLYEKTRLNEGVNYGHGMSASRLVSLGHLLHLAECEAERLQKDLK